MKRLRVLKIYINSEPIPTKQLNEIFHDFDKRHPELNAYNVALGPIQEDKK